MLFDENDLKNALASVVTSFKTDLKSIRTGRPTNDIFEQILIDYYGTKTPLTYLAQIAFTSATSITITVNDKNAADEVKKALEDSNLGSSIAESEKGVFKLNFHPLTEDTRKERVKELRILLEEKKVRARQVRQKFMELIKDLEKVSEDEQKRSEEQVQKMIDECISNLDKISAEKEADLMAV